MISAIVSRILGYSVVFLSKDPSVADLLLKKQFPMGKLRIENDQIRMDVPFSSRKKIQSKLQALGIVPIQIIPCGLPALIYRYKYRREFFWEFRFSFFFCGFPPSLFGKFMWWEMKLSPNA